jgi:hypothetical protein
VSVGVWRPHRCACHTPLFLLSLTDPTTAIRNAPPVRAPPHTLSLRRASTSKVERATWAVWARCCQTAVMGHDRIPREVPPIPCGWIRAAQVWHKSIGRFLFPEIDFNLNPYKSVQTSKIHRKLSRTRHNIHQSSFESFLIYVHSGLVKYVSLLVISFLELK